MIDGGSGAGFGSLRECEVRTYLMPRSIEPGVSNSTSSKDHTMQSCLMRERHRLPYSDLAINIVAVYGGVLVRE